jgi:hypothetical protein
MRNALATHELIESPEAIAFFEFTGTMRAYQTIIADNTTLVLTTDSDLLKYLKGMTPDDRPLTTSILTEGRNRQAMSRTDWQQQVINQTPVLYRLQLSSVVYLLSKVGRFPPMR